MDEVSNALSYYDITFLSQLPRLHNAIEDRLGKVLPAGVTEELPAFLRPGSWIGGDRDGNPFVTAEVLVSTLRLHSQRAMSRYLDQVHKLGAGLSSTTRVVGISPALAELAARSPDHGPHRDDEPYRRAIAGIYARLAATARQLDGLEAPRHAVGDAPVYASADEFRADLDILHDSLLANNSALLARGRLRRLRRSVAVFGFYLAPLDLRQNSAVHEQTVADLFAAVRPGLDYLALDEPARVALLLEELHTARPLVSPFVRYSEATTGELAIFNTARSLLDSYGAGAIENVIIAKTDGVSDLLELALLLKEVGPAVAAGTHACGQYRAAVRDHRRPGPGRRHHGQAVLHPALPAVAGIPWRHAGSDGRLFRQQQGWRLPDLGLEPVRRGEGIDRCLQQARRQAAPVPWPWRLGRARWRPQLPGHPGAAGGRGAGLHPHY
jgi:phosphoenolpyruvate carboxylase